MTNFDKVATVYDRLARLVFGKSIYRAQILYLREIPPGASVLILGGGTGWLLAELLVINPHCQVVYIEASMKMLELTKQKIDEEANGVLFIHGTEETIPAGLTFDAVITHFYLDLFDRDSCAKVIRRIRRVSHTKSLWLVCDFLYTTWWQGVMLWAMYLFFDVISGLKVNTLPDWKKLIDKKGFVEIKSETFYKGFIGSTLYRVQETEKGN